MRRKAPPTGGGNICESYIKYVFAGSKQTEIRFAAVAAPVWTRAQLTLAGQFRSVSKRFDIEKTRISLPRLGLPAWASCVILSPVHFGLFAPSLLFSLSGAVRVRTPIPLRRSLLIVPAYVEHECVGRRGCCIIRGDSDSLTWFL
jgi:hypothetical protein